ncbi:MAG: DUF3341 domain-containing protein [Opitutaceae bacterium]
MAEPTYGLIAAFDTPGELFQAARQVRDAGFKRWDCITPFPIHGLEGAMGLRRSTVPRISLVGGITGFCTGMTMIWYMNAFDFPLTVGGKPLFSPLFAFPISYELLILFTTFATIIGMFIYNGLGKLYHPVLKFDRIAKAMNDRFFIVIETRDPRYQGDATRSFLSRIGGKEIAELED